MHCECTANALRMPLSRPLSRTSRVALQAKPLMAANEEVRSLAMRVGVRRGARECTREYGMRANHPPRGRRLGVFLYRKTILEHSFSRRFKTKLHRMTERFPSGRAVVCAVVPQ